MTYRIVIEDKFTGTEADFKKQRFFDDPDSWKKNCLMNARLHTETRYYEKPWTAKTHLRNICQEFFVEGHIEEATDWKRV